MDTADIELRNATYRRFAELGRAPAAAEVAALTNRSEAEVRDAWRRLHDGHALVLDAAGEIRMANPFAAQPTAFRVEAARTSWYANCAWDAFGIGAALDVDRGLLPRQGAYGRVASASLSWARGSARPANQQPARRRSAQRL